MRKIDYQVTLKCSECGKETVIPYAEFKKRHPLSLVFEQGRDHMVIQRCQRCGVGLIAQTHKILKFEEVVTEIVNIHRLLNMLKEAEA